MAYDWPGNVRELENVIERQVITAQKHLDIHLLPKPHQVDAAAAANSTNVLTDNALQQHSAMPSTELLSDAEFRALEIANTQRALAQCRGQVFGEKGAAELLGIKPTTLVSRLKKWGLTP